MVKVRDKVRVGDRVRASCVHSVILNLCPMHMHGRFSHEYSH